MDRRNFLQGHWQETDTGLLVPENTAEQQDLTEVKSGIGLTRRNVLALGATALLTAGCGGVGVSTDGSFNLRKQQKPSVFEKLNRLQKFISYKGGGPHLSFPGTQLAFPLTIDKETITDIDFRAINTPDFQAIRENITPFVDTVLQSQQEYTALKNIIAKLALESGKAWVNINDKQTKKHLIFAENLSFPRKTPLLHQKYITPEIRGHHKDIKQMYPLPIQSNILGESAKLLGNLTIKNAQINLRKLKDNNSPQDIIDMESAGSKTEASQHFIVARQALKNYEIRKKEKEGKLPRSPFFISSIPDSDFFLNASFDKPVLNKRNIKAADFLRVGDKGPLINAILTSDQLPNLSKISHTDTLIANTSLALANIYNWRAIEKRKKILQQASPEQETQKAYQQARIDSSLHYKESQIYWPDMEKNAAAFYFRGINDLAFDDRKFWSEAKLSLISAQEGIQGSPIMPQGEDPKIWLNNIQRAIEIIEKKAQEWIEVNLQQDEGGIPGKLYVANRGDDIFNFRMEGIPSRNGQLMFSTNDHHFQKEISNISTMEDKAEFAAKHLPELQGTQITNMTDFQTTYSDLS